MKELVTTETIIGWLKTKIENREPIQPSVWLDSAQKLIVLWSDLSDEYAELQTKVAQYKVGQLDLGKSVAEVRTRAEALEDYKRMKQIKGRMDLITEYIRIAKQRAKMKWEEEHFNN